MNNPVFLYFKYLLKKYYFECKLTGFRLGYMSSISQSEIGKYVRLFDYVVVYKSKIGSFSYIASRSLLMNCAIGKFCSIGAGVQIGLQKHPIDFISSHPAFYSTLKQANKTFIEKTIFQETLPVQIGNDVWIGNDVKIIGGIKVGNGAVIGAGAVVTKDIPDYAVVGGVPAKLIKYRFDAETINNLNHISWWDWDEDKLLKNSIFFTNVNEFINMHKDV